jgi:Xaa-Pro aminopeptidase
VNPSLRTGIPAAEYRERADRVAALALDAGMDAVLAWSRGGGTVDRYANVLYLTNYYNPWPGVLDFPPMWTGQANAGVLVTRDGERVLVTNVPEGEWRDSSVHCEAFVDEPHIHLGVARALAERGLTGARVGLAASDSMTVGLYRALLEATPAVRWAAADDLLLEARRIKSPAEMAVIREAVAAGDAMMEAMLASVVPGALEADVHRAGWRAGLDRGVALYDTPGASGPLAEVFGPTTLPNWSERRLDEGDLWHTDMYGVWQGYLFDFSRSSVAGEPSAEQLEILEASVAIVDEVIASIRPGVTFAEAHAAGVEATARHAGELPRKPAEGAKHDYPHFGHTIGLGWENLWIYPGEHRTFEHGMHVAVETSAGRAGIGFAMFEQNLLVVPGGVELTSRCTKRPWRADPAEPQASA